MPEKTEEKKEGIVVDLNAFKAKEGGYVPPEKTPEEIAAEALAAGTAGQKTPEELAAEAAASAGEFTPNTTWAVLKEKHGIEVPEGLTAETEMQVLNETIGGIKGEEPVALHPMALELNNKLADPEFKMDEWINEQAEQLNVLTLTGREFFEKTLPNQYPDASEEDLKEVIDQFETSGSMKMKELDMKKAIRGEQESAKATLIEANKEAVTKSIVAENTRVQAEVDKLFVETEKVTEIRGIPISEAERVQFNNVFKELTTIDEEGKMPLNELLQSNDVLYQVAFFLVNGDEKIKKELFEAKEGTKKKIFEKLKPTPTSGLGKAAGAPVPTKVDLEVLKQPQQ